MKKSTIFTILALLILSVLIINRIIKNGSTDESNKNDLKKNDKPIAVNAVVLSPETFSNSISISGTIEPNEMIEIRPEVSGVVTSINFNEGSFVSKGQLLVKINDIELKAQLSQAKTKANLASENARRAKLLLQKEAISQEEYDITNSEYLSANAQIQLINAQISRTSIYAPFAGKVGLRSISKGSYISPTTLIAKLVNTSQVKISFSIPEKYASSISNKSTLSFTTSSNNTEYLAKIYAIEPAIDLQTRTLQIKAIANNTNGTLLPGTFASINLPLHEINDALFVPSEAVIPIQNGKKVFISEGGKAKEVVIESTVRTDKRLLVENGLKTGDTVITSGIMSLKEGAILKILVKK
jgi:membrane fusion protein, multidrug efflux system